MSLLKVMAGLDAKSQSVLDSAWRRFGRRPHDGEPDYWPRTVRLTQDVRSEIPGDELTLLEGAVCPSTSNRYGAICGEVDGRLLGLKPREYDVVSWISERPATEAWEPEP